MIDTFRSAIVALTRLVLGGGHAACACVAVAGALNAPVLGVSSSSDHSHHSPAQTEPQGVHCDEGSEDESHDCTQCLTVALPADASAKVVSTPQTDLPVVTPLPESSAGNTFRLTNLRIEPARGPPPPFLSLVTLKVRLQN
jgi:hypothetical protein